MRPLASDHVVIKSIPFSFEDISNVIDAFYREVATDPLLSVPFSSVTDWPHHIERLIHFWWIRFGGRAYLEVNYNPIGKHFEAGFNQEFLECWLALFKKIVYQELTAAQAEIWESVTISMGSALSRNNEMMKQHYAT